jgi:isoleucyl-tRNA synthetase
VSPDEVIPKLGAEVLRLWCASSDYFEDMRCSEEILQRVTDGYRKLRNTARFALGNLYGFDPARDSVPENQMLEIDHWALVELDNVIKKVRDAYEAYEFHLVYHTLYDFCTVTLSARYFDIIKDRLYTFAPRNHARRSAQTALYHIAEALARMLAPILVFTADEIWENLPATDNGALAASVHMSTLPASSGTDDSALAANWQRLFEVRDEVLRSLEEARVAKVIGSSLDARVELRASGDTYQMLARYESELRYLFIVSQVTLTELEHAGSSATGGVEVGVRRAQGEKCERCWNYSTHVGESPRYPTVCERCMAALEEIESETN